MFLKTWRVLISNLITFFQISVWKNPSKAFWSQIWKSFVLHENLRFDKFEGRGFKYDNNFFKFYYKIPKQSTFGPNFKIFLSEILHSLQFQGCWFQICQWFFRIKAQKYPNKASFVSKLKSLFSRIFAYCHIPGF